MELIGLKRPRDEQIVREDENVWTEIVHRLNARGPNSVRNVWWNIDNLDTLERIGQFERRLYGVIHRVYIPTPELLPSLYERGIIVREVFFSDNEYNEPIGPGLLADSIVSIGFGDNSAWNQPLHHFPRELLALRLGNDWNRPLPHFQIYMPNLRILELGDAFNYPLQREDDSPVLPEGLFLLQLGHGFNQTIRAELPDRLAHLHIGDGYDKPLPTLPDQLISLHLGDGFNQPIDFQLPLTLQYLYLGDSFNQPLTRFGPNLMTLFLGNAFDQALAPHLPPSMMHLHLGESYDYALPDMTGWAHLEQLTLLNEDMMVQNEFDLPRGIKQLQIGERIFNFK